tara:strand:- start:44 stop:250 length:207 start_codon:yes stop_codon:yes gene_type:complete
MNRILLILKPLFLILNWIILGPFGLILIGASVNSNARLFVFGMGSIAIAFIIHLIINILFSSKKIPNK